MRLKVKLRRAFPWTPVVALIAVPVGASGLEDDHGGDGMFRWILGGLFAAVLALGWLVGPASVQAQGLPIWAAHADARCPQEAYSRCDTACGDDGPCKYGCQIGGTIQNRDTCTSSCSGLGAPCLNACYATVDQIDVCHLPRVSGVVSGLGAGKSVVLQNNGADTLPVNANGAFTFPISVIVSTPFAVTVSGQPEGQTCFVANGSGAAPRWAVTGVAVTCASHVPMLSNWRMPLLVWLLALAGLLLSSPILVRRLRSRA